MGKHCIVGIPEFICDVVYRRRWWIPLLLAVLAQLPGHSHREEPLRPGEGPSTHLPGEGAGLAPRHPAAGTQFALLLTSLLYTSHSEELFRLPIKMLQALRTDPTPSHASLHFLLGMVSMSWCQGAEVSMTWRWRGASLPPCRLPLTRARAPPV